MTTQKAIERSSSNTLPTQPSAETVVSRDENRNENRWHYSPHADIYETDDEFTIVLDMPGVPAENVEITCEKSALIVRGRVEQPAQAPEPPKQHNESRRPIRIEYGIGDYFRRFGLGDTIDTDRITASHSKPSASGVVTVRLPKVEQHRPIRIAVTNEQ